MPNFFYAKYMSAMVPTNRAVHNKKKIKENLCIYTLKQDLTLPGSLTYNDANTEIHTRQADLFNLISH